MALPQAAFDILRNLAPCRLLSLGYPDLLVRDEFDVLEVANADILRKSHKWTGKIYETDAVFQKCGIEATYADIANHTGCEVLIDLNEDMVSEERFHFMPSLAIGPRFDAVLDPGTLEHCFNIGQAFANVREFCRAGGHILHLNPVNISNHGFWNISPTTYYDFYEHHGDVVKSAAMFDRQGNVRESRRQKRVVYCDPLHNMMLIQRSDVATMSRGWPVQAKYRKEEGNKNAMATD